MAIVNKNLVTQGLSGSLGRTLVFRRVGNRTIVSTVPATSKDPSAAQLTQREKFQQAVLYAKSQMADPALKADYEQAAKGNDVPNAYNIAVAISLMHRILPRLIFRVTPAGLTTG